VRPWSGLFRDDHGTSDVEYILLTALIVIPLLVVPALIIQSNRAFWDRVSYWTSLPFP
jgi:hypothetical protein